MPRTRRIVRTIEIPKGWPSKEAGSFVAQLDELSGRMFDDLTGTPTADLAWQAAKGQNTVGMLLAHNAVVEVFWLQIATGSYTQAKLEKVLRIGEYDDGMPLAANGAPPVALRGRTLAWYQKLHDRARAHTKALARRMRPADMRRAVVRTRPDGTVVSNSVRWILYHVLEHQAGHYGQMLLLLHQRRDARKRAR